MKAAAAIWMALAAAGCSVATGTKCTGGTAVGNVVITSEVGLQLMVGCQHIKGHLTVMSETLTRVDELASLTTVDGGVSINSNDMLVDVSGLASLTSVGGGHLVGGSGFYMAYNPMLTDATFPALTLVAGEFGLGGAGLTNVSFPALTSIGGGLSFLETTSLTTLAGLSGVKTIGGNLMIQRNQVLTDTAGLSGLTAVPADLLVADNAVLTTLSLPSVTSVGATGPSPTSVGPSSQQVYVSSNAALTGISLPALTFVGPGGVRIYNNPLLPQCQADAVAAAAGQPCNCGGNTGPAACN